ncbi:hypothetical protein LINPERHAP2_LOCUS11351 [Linum perenne]
MRADQWRCFLKH